MKTRKPRREEEEEEEEKEISRRKRRFYPGDQHEAERTKDLFQGAGVENCSLQRSRVEPLTTIRRKTRTHVKSTASQHAIRSFQRRLLLFPTSFHFFISFFQTLLTSSRRPVGNHSGALPPGMAPFTSKLDLGSTQLTTH